MPPSCAAEENLFDSVALSEGGLKPALQVRFENPIARVDHAERGIGRLCACVVAFDVQAQADDAGRRTRELFDMRVQRGEYALAAMSGRDIDALDPPPVAVAPVAPFAREHQRADRAA